MTKPILYSTNPVFTQFICENFREQKYVIWCCECFDPATDRASFMRTMSPPSSSPKEIYADLRRAIESEDNSCGKIDGYKETFRCLAHDWLARDEISKEVRDEIITLTERDSWELWKPELYIIPRAAIEEIGKVKRVPAESRAGLGDEFQVHDLLRTEFDVIRLE